MNEDMRTLMGVYIARWGLDQQAILDLETLILGCVAAHQLAYAQKLASRDAQCGVENSLLIRHVLFPVDTVGCYYTDVAGKPWTTFEMMNSQIACDDCGKKITRGYSRGKYGDETYHCIQHVLVHKMGVKE